MSAARKLRRQQQRQARRNRRRFSATAGLVIEIMHRQPWHRRAAIGWRIVDRSPVIRMPWRPPAANTGPAAEVMRQIGRMPPLKRLGFAWRLVDRSRPVSALWSRT